MGSSVGVGGFTRLIVEGGDGEGGVDMGTNVRASDDAHAVNDKTMKNNREMISLGILFIIFNVELNQGCLSFGSSSELVQTNDCSDEIRRYAFLIDRKLMNSNVTGQALLMHPTKGT